MVENSGSFILLHRDLKPEEMQPWAAATPQTARGRITGKRYGRNQLPSAWPESRHRVGNLPLELSRRPA